MCTRQYFVTLLSVCLSVCLSTFSLSFLFVTLLFVCPTTFSWVHLPVILLPLYLLISSFVWLSSCSLTLCLFSTYSVVRLFVCLKRHTCICVYILHIIEIYSIYINFILIHRQYPTPNAQHFARDGYNVTYYTGFYQAAVERLKAKFPKIQYGGPVSLLVLLLILLNLFVSVVLLILFAFYNFTLSPLTIGVYIFM